MTSGVDASAAAESVRRYYDTNATAFERLGQGGASIHRAVWGPGVTTRAGAFHYVDDLILAALPAGVERHTVVDLGCGLGASLLYLADGLDLRGEGITISSRQAARAATLVAEAEVSDRVRCREGNYLAVPDDLFASSDVTFSIEAFIHTPDVDGYFREAARTLRAGGKLIICDDFLTTAEPTPGRWLAEFRTGWHAAALLTVDELRTRAAAHGLTLAGDVDLTPYLELRRPRDRMISALVALGRITTPRGEYWQSLVGGNALQWGLTHGQLSYRFLELTRD